MPSAATTAATRLVRRLILAGVAVLVLGLGSAFVLSKVARDDDAGVLGYEIVNGKAYPIKPGDTKQYNVQLEKIGGKSVVVTEEFRQWFLSLWRGRQLPVTLAWLSVCLSFLCFWAAYLASAPAPRTDAGPPGKGLP